MYTAAVTGSSSNSLEVILWSFNGMVHFAHQMIRRRYSRLASSLQMMQKNDRTITCTKVADGAPHLLHVNRRDLVTCSVPAVHYFTFKLIT